MLSLAGLEDPPVQLCPGNMTSMDKLRKPSFYFDQSLAFVVSLQPENGNF